MLKGLELWERHSDEVKEFSRGMLYLTIGLIVFGYAERLAKRRGLLGQY